MVVRNTRSLKKKLGDILVDVGIITQEQLKQALGIQHARGGKLGTILQELNFCSEEVLLAFLGRQCGVSYVSIAEYGKISPDVIRRVPESVVRHQTLIPLSCDDNVLTIAMSDPLNVFATDDLKQITGCEIKVVIASHQEIIEAIKTYYGKEPAVAGEETSSLTGAAAVVGAPVASGIKSEVVFDAKVPSVDGFINELLRSIVDSGASDLHLEQSESSVRGRLKIGGQLQAKTNVFNVAPDEVLAGLKGMAGWPAGSSHDEGGIKTQLDGRDVFFRLNVQWASSGWEAHIHWVNPLRINPDLTFLGLENDTWDALRLVIEKKQGVVLLSSPAAHGLTTTYYSLLSALTQGNRHVLSVESPVELLLPGAHQIEISRLERLSGIGLMHQSPDVVGFADTNTTEEAVALLDSASGGAFGLASLQARSSAEALTHFVQLAGIGGWTVSLIEGILSQRLVRSLCPNCKVSAMVPMDALLPEQLSDEQATLAAGRKVEIFEPMGCERCGQTGYDGRTAVFEYSPLTESLRKKIVQGATSAEIERELTREGKRTIHQAAVTKVLAGITSLEEIQKLLPH